MPGIYRPRHPERTVLYRVLFHNFDRFLTACKTRGFCPSCHAKRREEWGQWVRETLLLDMAHRQVVLTIPKTLRIFFKYRRRLLGELSRASVKALTVYFEALAGEPLVPGIIVAVQTFCDRINFHPHLHLLVTEGGMGHVPDVDGRGRRFRADLKKAFPVPKGRMRGIAAWP